MTPKVICNKAVECSLHRKLEGWPKCGHGVAHDKFLEGKASCACHTSFRYCMDTSSTCLPEVPRADM